MQLPVHAHFEYRVRERPDLPFLIKDGRTLTYGEADIEANRFAHALAAAGLGKGDRIAYLSKNTIEMAVMFLAAAKAGVAPVPLNFRLAPRECAYIVRDCGCKAVFTRGPEYTAGIQSIRDEIPATGHFVTLDREVPDGWTSFTDFVAGQPATKPDIPVDADDVLYIMYTSGTTGLPKGVMISHANVLCHVTQSMSASPASKAPGERALVVTPLYHAAGGLRIMTAAVCGTTIVLHENFEPAGLVAALERDRINTVNMVPAIVQSLLDEVPDLETRNFEHLKVIYYGAAPIAETTLRRALKVFQCDFVHGYGLTEATGGFVYMNERDHLRALAGRPDLLLSCGRPVLGAEVRIVDSSGTEIPRGAVGEIVVRNASIMKGYWGLPDATAEVIRDGWLRTGDAAYMDGEGYIFLKDRIKDMIVTGGENVYPVEVESALLEHPAIVDAAVVGVPDSKYGEAVMAFCVLKEGMRLTAEEVIAHCRGYLGGYKIPRRFEFVAELPRNPSGKILKRVLREPYWHGHDRRIG